MDDETRRLGRMFGDAYELWQRETYGGLEKAGFPHIRPAHSPVFRHIEETGSRVVTLAAAAGMTKQSMAYLVNNLEESGYLEIGVDPEDGRARLVRMTESGSAARKFLEKQSSAFERRVAKAIGPERLGELRALIAAVLDAETIAE